MIRALSFLFCVRGLQRLAIYTQLTKQGEDGLAISQDDIWVTWGNEQLTIFPDSLKVLAGEALCFG